MIHPSQIKVVLLCCDISEKKADRATTIIMNIIDPIKYPKPVKAPEKVKLSEIPIGKNFRLVLWSKEYIKMSESTYKAFCSTGKCNKWLNLDVLVYPVK